MGAEEAHYLLTYYVDGEYFEQNEYAEIPPVVGQGLQIQGRFFRIVDVWDVREKHAPVTHGVAVFLNEVDTPEAFLEVDARFYT